MNFHLSGFVEVPSPPVMIVTMEERHVYMCNHSQADRIFWRVNDGVLGSEVDPPNVATEPISLPGGGRVYTLTIGGLPEHNETSIQCSAAFDDESIPEQVTPKVTFLIQGQLYFAHLYIAAYSS